GSARRWSECWKRRHGTSASRNAVWRARKPRYAFIELWDTSTRTRAIRCPSRVRQPPWCKNAFEPRRSTMSDPAHSFALETHRFGDDGTVPNNSLPLVLYRGALPDSGDRATACEEMFDRNGWPDAWRNGIYAHHHYHSTAHEVLGIAAGSARVRLGGEHGQSV